MKKSMAVFSQEAIGHARSSLTAEEMVRKAFGLHSAQTQALDAVAAFMAQREILGDAQCHAAIFVEQRRFGETTNSRVQWVAERLLMAESDWSSLVIVVDTEAEVQRAHWVANKLSTAGDTYRAPRVYITNGSNQ